MTVHVLKGTSSSNDPSALKGVGSSAFVHLKLLTANAHAVLNTRLVDITSMQTDNQDVARLNQQVMDKLHDVKANLDTAQKHADKWLEVGGLNDRLSSLVPHHILDFSATYHAVNQALMDLLHEAKQPGADQPTLKTQVVELIRTGLLRPLENYKTEMQGAATDLEGYRKDLLDDHHNLFDSSSSITALINLEKGEVNQLNSDIQRLHDEIDALNKQVMFSALGLGGSIFVGLIGLVVCAVPGGQVAGGVLLGLAVVGAGVSAGFLGSAETQIKNDWSKIHADESAKGALSAQLLSLTSLSTTVQHLDSLVTDAQKALSDVATFWTTFQLTLDSVIEQLGKPDTTLPMVLDELYINTANNEWSQLEQFAQQLFSMPTEVQVDQKLVA